MNIDYLGFRHIRLLDALLRNRSVSEAVRYLDVPQPTASHGLTRLREALDEERYGCFASPDHPYMVSGENADFLGADHVLASAWGLAHAHREVEQKLLGIVDPVQVHIITGSFLVALLTAGQTGLIVTLPGRILEPLARELGLASAEPPTPLKGFEVNQYWHARHHEDPAHKWLRRSLYEALSSAISPS